MARTKHITQTKQHSSTTETDNTTAADPANSQTVVACETPVDLSHYPLVRERERERERERACYDVRMLPSEVSSHDTRGPTNNATKTASSLQQHRLSPPDRTGQACPVL